ncbi:tetratricopeptide TPR_2, putative [gamma proteobacterium HTCC5015]|nr:tetratricopeptide TPR_2, putative [gamma proteobacterium HTCC5015]
MKHTLKLFVIFTWVVSLLAVPTAMSVVGSEVQAAEQKSRIRRTPTLRPNIFKMLDQARESADAQQYGDATAKLDKLSKIRRNSYEKAMTWNMYAYVHFNQENYSEAAKAYENVLKEDRIPVSLEENTLYSLAKLYLIQEQYQKALTPLNKWFDLAEKPGAEAHILRAQIFYQLEQFNKALPEIRTAGQIARSKGKKMRENWLLLERAIYYQNKDYNGLERSLKDLLALYPKASYWVQLAAVYNQLGDETKELAAMEAAYEQDYLEKEQHYISLTQMMLANEVPFKAAGVLQQGIDQNIVEANERNLSLLADSWMMAKEYDKAIAALKLAAKESETGDNHFKLAQLFVERREWQQASVHVDAALKQGGLRQTSSAYVLKGMIEFNLEDFSQARQAFKKAKKDEQTAKAAQQWLKHIEAEEQRRAYLQSVS